MSSADVHLRMSDAEGFMNERNGNPQYPCACAAQHKAVLARLIAGRIALRFRSWRGVPTSGHAARGARVCVGRAASRVPRLRCDDDVSRVAETVLLHWETAPRRGGDAPFGTATHDVPSARSPSPPLAMSTACLVPLSPSRVAHDVSFDKRPQLISKKREAVEQSTAKFTCAEDAKAESIRARHDQ